MGTRPTGGPAEASWNPPDSANWCVIVPAYREHGRIGRTVEGIRSYSPNVVVVDDGSGDGTADEAQKAGAAVICHDVNQGKGAALNTAFRYAQERTYDFVITMDADGQHDPSDLPAFVEEFRRSGTPVLVGNRMDDPRTMPWIRRLTNRFMSWLLSRRMGQVVPDTQSGYRLYRGDLLPLVMAESPRYAAESESLLRLAEHGARIGSVPIRVIYRDERSKIRPGRDTIRFFSMLRRYDREKKARSAQGDSHAPAT
jgi:glycosyltransferase involved in cell wall biosynthesis